MQDDRTDAQLSPYHNEIKSMTSMIRGISERTNLTREDIVSAMIEAIQETKSKRTSRFSVKNFGERLSIELGFMMSILLTVLPAVALTFLVRDTTILSFYAQINPDLAHAAAYFTLWLPTAALVFRLFYTRVDNDARYHDEAGNQKNMNVIYALGTLKNLQQLCVWATIFVLSFDIIWMIFNWMSWYHYLNGAS